MHEGTRQFHIVVVGLGNIGSHLIPHLGRMADVGRVTVIDRDSYEDANVSGQDILASEAGRPKAVVQARRLRRIHPRIHVTPIHAEVETLPPGILQGDAILAGVDNRRARQHINEVAWQLGAPWIDAAVDAAGLLARVGVYVPGDDSACLECGWNENDYLALAGSYPCDGGRRSGAAPSPTAAPSSLGALAASLQAIECRELLAAGAPSAAAGRQIFFDLRHHQYYCTFLRRNPRCRRTQHAAWSPVPLDIDPRAIPAGDLLARGRAALDGAPADARPCELRVNDLRWVRQMVCCSCGAVRGALHLLRGPLVTASRTCPKCGGRMQARGLEVAAGLSAGMLSEAQKRRSLHALGIRDGDILTLEEPDGALFRGRITCHAV